MNNIHMFSVKIGTEHTYCKIIKSVKEWCKKQDLIFLPSCSLSLTKKNNKEYFIFCFDADFGYLRMDAWGTTSSKCKSIPSIYHMFDELDSLIKVRHKFLTEVKEKTNGFLRNATWPETSVDFGKRGVTVFHGKLDEDGYLVSTSYPFTEVSALVKKKLLIK